MTDFATLKADIATYMTRTDLTSAIPTFVRLAESRIRNDVRAMRQQSFAVGTIASGTFDAPSDFLEAISVCPDVENARDLTYVPPHIFFASQEIEDVGNAIYYTVSGDEFYFAPVPSDGVTVDLMYWAGFAALTGDADTNWLLTNHYGVYLYASVAEGKAFIEDDEGAAKWLGQYKEAVFRVNKEAKLAQLGGRLARRMESNGS